MRKRLSTLFAAAAVIAVLAAAAVTPAKAQSTLEAVKAEGKVIAGVKADYPPFGYTDKDGNLVGFDIDVMKYLAKRLGVDLELRPVTSANRIPMLMNGTVDILAASMTITQKRAQVVDFSVPYVLIGGKFLVRKGSDIKGYDDLAGKTVAFTQGTPWGGKLKAAQPEAEHLVLQDKPQAVLAVLQGKADAYVDDAAPLYWFARDHRDEVTVVGESTAPAPMGLGVRPNDSEWRDYVNFTLIELWEDGTYLELYKKHFGDTPPPSFVIYNWKL